MSSLDDWNRREWPKLWLYNLHYFDDLVADGAVTRADWHRSLIGRWIRENSTAKGVGWEPYPTSLRVVNWIKWALSGNMLVANANASLAVQVRWLLKRLEIHLLGNHLWTNAKALVFAGVYFQGKEADRWRNKGLALLRRELSEQILADGGHFERSPMYHAILLEDLMDLLQLAQIFPETIPAQDAHTWRKTVPQMLRWLRVMTHPDGEIAFFNDSAIGVAPTCDELTSYANSLKLEISEEPLAAIEPLRESGYVRMEAGPAVLIADVGKIGPDYLPAHAHADTLSFELSLYGRRVLVNGGISTYEASAERLRQRGTAEHNALQVDGVDSSEVWGSFRVARRAKPRAVSWTHEAGGTILRAGHDGYASLGHGCTGRSWCLWPDRLRVLDKVDGRPKSAIARFRSHPSFGFRRGDGLTGTLEGSRISIGWLSHNAAQIHIAPGVWHRGFGQSQPCQILELSMSGNRLDTEFYWADG